MYERKKERAEVIGEHSGDLERKAEDAWKQMKSRLRKLWVPLSEEDLDRNRGERNLLLSVIQEKSGQARDEVARKLDEIADEVGYPLK